VYRIKKLKSGHVPTKGGRAMVGWMDGRTNGQTDRQTDTEDEGVMQVEIIGEMRNAYFYSGNLKERDRFVTAT
jgi:hypothetical protein